MTDYAFLPLRCTLVPSWEDDRYEYPSRIELSGIGDKGAPDVEVIFEWRDGVPEVTHFQLTAKENGRAVRTSDLAGWQLEGLAINVFRQRASLKDPAEARRRMDETGREDPYGPFDDREFWTIGKALESARTSRQGPDRAELEQVAEIYRAHFHERPTEAVQKSLGYSRRTAARRVQQARESGLLPATSPGKKNA